MVSIISQRNNLSLGENPNALGTATLPVLLQKQVIQPWFDLQLNALNSCLFTYNTFIKILYMFRALTLLIIRRSSPFLTGAQDSHLLTVTIPEAAHIQLRREPPDDERG